MDKVISLTLVKSLIMESVKNETYQRGQTDKAADQKNIVTAYHEQAGDEDYHLRILDRALYTNLSELKTILAEYLSPSSDSTGDNIYSTEEGDTIIINLTVSTRFNDALTDPLAKLCSKFIEENMLADWWKPINKDQSALYATFAEKDLASIRRCFNKKAPAAPTIPYTSTIAVTGSAVDIGVGEITTITYSLSDGAVNDIEVEVENNTLIDVRRTENAFAVEGKQRGHTYVRLYSRHRPSVNAIVNVYVTDQQ